MIQKTQCSLSGRSPLEQGMMVNGYSVDELIGCGGSSLAYRMTKNNISYIVKELYPEKLTTSLLRDTTGKLICISHDEFRDYKHNSKNEYKTLQRIVKLKNGNNSTVLLPPIEQFEANNTIYTVLTNTNCLLLSELQEKLELPEFLYVFKLVLNAVASLHGDNISNGLYSDWLPEDSEQAVNLLHLDIAPANMVFSLDNETIRAHVIDFNTSAILEKGEDGFLSDRNSFEVKGYRRAYSHINLIRAAKGIKNIRITKKMDIYSLVAVLFEYILNRHVDSDDLYYVEDGFCEEISQRYPLLEADVIKQINDIFIKVIVSDEYATVCELYSDIDKLYYALCKMIQAQPISEKDSALLKQLKNNYADIHQQIKKQIENKVYRMLESINGTIEIIENNTEETKNDIKVMAHKVDSIYDLVSSFPHELMQEIANNMKKIHTPKFIASISYLQEYIPYIARLLYALPNGIEDLDNPHDKLFFKSENVFLHMGYYDNWNRVKYEKRGKISNAYKMNGRFWDIEFYYHIENDNIHIIENGYKMVRWGFGLRLYEYMHIPQVDEATYYANEFSGIQEYLNYFIKEEKVFRNYWDFTWRDTALERCPERINYALSILRNRTDIKFELGRACRKL